MHFGLLDLGAVALVAEHEQRLAGEFTVLEQLVQLLLGGGDLVGLCTTNDARATQSQ